MGLFEILQKVGPVAYHLALPSSLKGIHDDFYVCNLQRFIPDPNHVIRYEPLQIRENLTYVEEPIKILGRMEKTLRNKTIPFVKVLWEHHQVTDATWESEQSIREKYPALFDINE